MKSQLVNCNKGKKGNSLPYVAIVTYLEVLQSVHQVALDVARVVNKVGFEQPTHERDLTEQVIVADRLGRFCTTNLDTGVHGNRNDGLVNKEVDKLVSVEGKFEALHSVKDRLQQILLECHQVLENSQCPI